jgi:hypothetical protein
MNAANKGTSKH